MRVALVFLLVCVAVVSAAVSWGSLHNLWADYKDSPDSTYLLTGLPFVVVAVACLAAAAVITHRRL